MLCSIRFSCICVKLTKLASLIKFLLFISFAREHTNISSVCSEANDQKTQGKSNNFESIVDH